MKKLSRKSKAGIVLVTALLASISIFSSTTLAHPPQTPEVPIRTFTGNVTVTLNATDLGQPSSGIDYILYEVWFQATVTPEPTPSLWVLMTQETTYTGPFTVSEGGYYQVHYYSVDNAGNVEAVNSKTFRILSDHTPGISTIDLTTDGIEITPHSP